MKNIPEIYKKLESFYPEVENLLMDLPSEVLDKCKPVQILARKLMYSKVESHTWSTVKIDRLGLQFYWRHVLNIDWQWIEIVKPPQFNV